MNWKIKNRSEIIRICYIIYNSLIRSNQREKDCWRRR